MKTRHIHAKGTKVQVFNGTTRDGDENTVPRLEGIATVVSFLDVDNYYKVRFAGERKSYSRFVNDDAKV